MCVAGADVAGTHNVSKSQQEMFVVIEQHRPQTLPPLTSSRRHRLRNPPSHCTSTRTKSRAPHTCPQCGKHYRSPRYLHIHQLSHSGLKPLLCHICGQGFYGRVNLNRHVLLRHGTSSLRHVCDRCGKSFVAAARLRRHITDLHNSPALRHSCDLCHATFANAGNLQRHRHSHSAEPRPYVCEICQKRFTQKTSLKAHNRQHDSEARRQAMCICPVCGKQISKSSNLRKHLLHHAPRP